MELMTLTGLPGSVTVKATGRKGHSDHSGTFCESLATLGWASFGPLKFLNNPKHSLTHLARPGWVCLFGLRPLPRNGVVRTRFSWCQARGWRCNYERGKAQKVCDKADDNDTPGGGGGGGQQPLPMPPEFFWVLLKSLKHGGDIDEGVC